MPNPRTKKHYRVATRTVESSKGIFIPDVKRNKLYLIVVIVSFLIFAMGLLVGFIIGRVNS